MKYFFAWNAYREVNGRLKLFAVGDGVVVRRECETEEDLYTKLKNEALRIVCDNSIGWNNIQIVSICKF